MRKEAVVTYFFLLVLGLE